MGEEVTRGVEEDPCFGAANAGCQGSRCTFHIRHCSCCPENTTWCQPGRHKTEAYSGSIVQASSCCNNQGDLARAGETHFSALAQEG